MYTKMYTKIIIIIIIRCILKENQLKKNTVIDKTAFKDARDFRRKTKLKGIHQQDKTL